jgi:dihydrofolate reductase
LSLEFGINCSLDGYFEDADGKFDWSGPSAEVHSFWNERERPIATYLYGRRMYETMRVWETMDDPDPVSREYAEIWRAARKIVFSRTLDEVTTANTTLEREFDLDLVRALDGRVTVGGPELAAEAFRAGLVSRIDLVIYPVIVGGGKRALPDGVRDDLRLESSRVFANGCVHVAYAR